MDPDNLPLDPDILPLDPENLPLPYPVCFISGSGSHDGIYIYAVCIMKLSLSILSSSKRKFTCIERWPNIHEREMLVIIPSKENIAAESPPAPLQLCL